MPRYLGIRVAAAVVLLGLAIAGYVLWIPVRHPDAHKVAALAVTAPVAGLRTHPKASSVDPAIGVPISAVKAAASATPGETAAYSVEWKGISPVTAGSLQLLAVPTVRYARSAHTELVASELSQTSFTDAGYGFGGTTSVSAIPGAKGAYYLKGTTPTVTASTPRASEVIFRTQRVLIAVTVEAKGVDATRTARALATAEYQHLGRVGADPVLARTSLPVVASLVYALVALAVLAVAELLPLLVTTAQRRRQQIRAEAQRRSRVSRGSKVVRRHSSRGYARAVTGSRARRR